MGIKKIILLDLCIVWHKCIKAAKLVSSGISVDSQAAHFQYFEGGNFNQWSKASPGPPWPVWPAHPWPGWWCAAPFSGLPPSSLPACTVAESSPSAGSPPPESAPYQSVYQKPTNTAWMCLCPSKYPMQIWLGCCWVWHWAIKATIDDIVGPAPPPAACWWATAVSAAPAPSPAETPPSPPAWARCPHAAFAADSAQPEPVRTLAGPRPTGNTRTAIINESLSRLFHVFCKNATVEDRGTLERNFMI